MNARQLLVYADVPDMLIKDYDLPPHHQDYFKPMAKDVCLKRFPVKYMQVNDPDSDLRTTTKAKDIGRRAIAVLPLVIGEVHLSRSHSYSTQEHQTTFI